MGREFGRVSGKCCGCREIDVVVHVLVPIPTSWFGWVEESENERVVG